MGFVLDEIVDRIRGYTEGRFKHGWREVWDFAVTLGWLGDPRLSHPRVLVPAGNVFTGLTPENIRWLHQGICQGATDIIRTDDHTEEPLAVATFEIDRFPVTNSQYFRFVEEKSYKEIPRYWVDRKVHLREANRPVVDVTCHDAEAYTKWLTEQNPLYEVRVPTEAEWMRAVRLESHKLWLWDGSFDRDLQANLHSLWEGKIPEVQGPSPIGMFPDGKGGLIEDVVGNVREWTLPQKRGTSLNPIKGSSYLDTWWHARCTRKEIMDPRSRSMSVGFRCVWIRK